MVMEAAAIVSAASGAEIPVICVAPGSEGPAIVAHISYPFVVR